MKNLKYFAITLACTLFAACQGDWDEPSADGAYGNSSIDDNNIITIQQLMTTYKSVIFASSDSYQLIDKDIKIKGRVTGNDIGSNLYKQFAIQDATGAIIISVNQSGMCGFIPEGQEIVIALQGLYIGGYRKQPQIGMPYNNKGAVSLGRMYKEIFQQHFKYAGVADATAIKPEAKSVTELKAWNKDDNCAKLIKLTGVKFDFSDVETKGDNLYNATFAPDTTGNDSIKQYFVGGCVNRKLEGVTRDDLVIRTSTYAKFAAKKLPQDKVNLTGIATRYNNTWQILIRKESDIEIVK